MKTITLTQKDIEKHNIQNTTTGNIIDELAFATGKYTPFDDCDYYDYEPNEPYSYDFEDDLFANTENGDALYELAQTLGVSLNANWSKIAYANNMHLGACVALNNPKQWQELLTAYTESLKENRTYSISAQYNTAMQKTLDDYYDDSYTEWLNGDRSNEGAVSIISKYFTDNRDGSYNKKENTYTFCIDDDTLQDYKDNGYTAAQTKRALLDSIKESSDAQKEKDRAENEKRRAEYAKTKAYKEERAKKEAEERKQKLLSMKVSK